MLVRDAHAIAQRWVETEAAGIPGFAGAFLSGSVPHLPRDAVLPASSDIDVKIVVDRAEVAPDPQKHLIDGVVLEPSWAPLSDLASAETVLANYYLAGHLATASILADPTGHLRAIQPAIARDVAHRRWVQARVEHAATYPPAVLDEAAQDGKTTNRIVGTWVLALCVMTHPALVADLRNPTIRKCLIAFEDTLAAYGRQHLHEHMLELLGSAHMQRAEVETRFAACTAAFDTACDLIATPFPHSSNISAQGRPMAIGGIREMIDGGHHREAMFWILVIHTWCDRVFENDAPEAIRTRLEPAYAELLAALGIATPADLDARLDATRALLTDVLAAAGEILDRNPRIVR